MAPSSRESAVYGGIAKCHHNPALSLEKRPIRDFGVNFKREFTCRAGGVVPRPATFPRGNAIPGFWEHVWGGNLRAGSPGAFGQLPRPPIWHRSAANLGQAVISGVRFGREFTCRRRGGSTVTSSFAETECQFRAFFLRERRVFTRFGDRVDDP